MCSACAQPFENVRLIRQITCPTFIVHGTDDDEIPIAHARMLYAAARHAAPPFWVRGAGHNDVVEHAEDEYFKRLDTFLTSLGPNPSSSSSSASSASSASD